MENMDRGTEHNPMNRDTLAGQWKQMRGSLKSWWGKLTDDDFDRIAGQTDRLVGTLQEKYGYTRDMAQREVDRRLKEYGEKNMSGGQSYSGMAENMGRAALDTAQSVAKNASQTMSDVKNKAQDLGSTVTEKAGNATTSLGGGMTSLAGVIRQNAPAEGTVGSAASAVAERLDAAGSYLQENGFENMARDLSGVIRRYPLQSLLIGFGLGYLVARNRER
jgi:uncharacterized protein YjbJ (UPF0337 family)